MVPVGVLGIWGEVPWEETTRTVRVDADGSRDADGIWTVSSDTYTHFDQTVFLVVSTSGATENQFFHFMAEFVHGALNVAAFVAAASFTGGLAGGLFGAWGAWAVEVGVKVLEIYFGYGLGQQLYSLASGFDAHDGHQLSSAEYWGSWGGLLGSIAGGYASGKVKLAARGKAMGEFVAGERCAWELSRACFAAGTMLLTPDGSVAIETLKVGDVVVSRNEYDINAPLTERRVLQTFERVAPVVNLHVNGEIIGTTESHPFWVVGKGWTAAGGLRIGDQLVGHDGIMVKVEGVAPSGRLVPVYNVEVEDDHTYFVMGDGWTAWVHNAECSITERDKPGGTTGEKEYVVINKETNEASIFSTREAAEAWRAENNHTFTEAPAGQIPGSESYWAEPSMSNRPTKTHGWEWGAAESAKRARDENSAQGKFGSKADAEHAMEASRDMLPGERKVIDPLPGTKNSLTYPNGDVTNAPKVFVWVRPNGQVHAFPVIGGYVPR